MAFDTVFVNNFIQLPATSINIQISKCLRPKSAVGSPGTDHAFILAARSPRSGQDGWPACLEPKTCTLVESSLSRVCYMEPTRSQPQQVTVWPFLRGWLTLGHVRVACQSPLVTQRGQGGWREAPSYPTLHEGNPLPLFSFGQPLHTTGDRHWANMAYDQHCHMYWASRCEAIGQ